MSDIFSGRGESDVRDDLVKRARGVQRDGWGPYRYVWSRGEVLFAALVLDDEAILAEFGETREDVLNRLAYDVYGLNGGPIEKANGWPDTLELVHSARRRLAT